MRKAWTVLSLSITLGLGPHADPDTLSLSTQGEHLRILDRFSSNADWTKVRQVKESPICTGGVRDAYPPKHVPLHTEYRNDSRSSMNAVGFRFLRSGGSSAIGRQPRGLLFGWTVSTDDYSP